MPTHEHFMQRAIELAERATGNTSPNPLVGAVIVLDNEIVAEGWHKKAGLPHAEVEAIQNAQKKQQTTDGATLYVTLEPCSHHGKTPPCTQAIIEAGFSDVVYATSDTNSHAAGGGGVLKAAGINVISGVCEAKAKHVNRFFFHYLHNQTPFVIAKFASSLDGRTATRTGNSQWITGAEARAKGHQIRQAVDAIVIGAETALTDQPQLTVRNPNAHLHGEAAHPLRIVLDSRGRVPIENAVFSPELPSQTLVVTTDAMPTEHANKLEKHGIEILTIPCNSTSKRPDLTLMLKALGSRGIQSLLVEGGQTVLGSFFDHGLANEVWAFIAPMLIGGTNAAPSIGGLGVDQLTNAPRLVDVSVENLHNDLLIKGTVNSCSPE